MPLLGKALFELAFDLWGNKAATKVAVVVDFCLGDLGQEFVVLDVLEVGGWCWVGWLSWVVFSNRSYPWNSQLCHQPPQFEIRPSSKMRNHISPQIKIRRWTILSPTKNRWKQFESHEFGCLFYHLLLSQKNHTLSNQDKNSYGILPHHPRLTPFDGPALHPQGAWFSILPWVYEASEAMHLGFSSLETN